MCLDAECGNYEQLWSTTSLRGNLEGQLTVRVLTEGAHSGLACGGGSIPFLRMLGERFPETQFLVTGVLGPHSNAHGPNEFLHIAYATRLTECVSLVLADHGSHLANRGAA